VALAASLALADRPSQLGFDPVVGFVLLAAIDRILTRGSDWIAGLWTMAASLMIGWPALVIVGLPTIVIGRASSYLSWRLVVPSLLAIAGWSAWALSTAQAEVWGAWLVAPIKQPLTWDWLPWIVALTLPWSPFALLVGLNGVRGSFPGSTRRSMLGWLQVSLALGLAATFLPGLVMSALPVAFGLVVVACSSLSRVVSAPTNGARMAVLLGVFGLCLLVSIPGVPYAAFLAAALPHYRPPALLTSVCLAFVFAIAAVAAWQGRVRWSVGCLVALALLVKLVHAEIYTPEWTYRLGQGPWGRAIGQWVPPNQPIYSVQTWPVELAFATERSMRTLVAPGWLDFVPGAGPHYVLLLDAEFQNWPVTAPKLQKMRSFQDPFGRIRVLARTIPKGAEPR
jgi:hypothetical protein